MQPTCGIRTCPLQSAMEAAPLRLRHLDDRPLMDGWSRRVCPERRGGIGGGLPEESPVGAVISMRTHNTWHINCPRNVGGRCSSSGATWSCSCEWMIVSITGRDLHLATQLCKAHSPVNVTTNRVTLGLIAGKACPSTKDLALADWHWRTRWQNMLIGIVICTLDVANY
uniref:HDC03977 n=1 Tax=Drosophila melanogaster TaxID=7227 RepID=Q6IH00_DROME|nr:TPA_inf: HDC03977 [Drosophila melanogaster]